MENYKELSAYEKLQMLQNMNFSRVERHNVAVYLNALRKNDRSTIEEYESFGNTPSRLLDNKRRYDRQALFGFTDKKFNEYGWLESPQFLDCEEIEFPHRDGWAVHNHINIGRGLNGKWSYGVSYAYSSGGAGYGLGIWGDIFDSKKECLISALTEMIEGLVKNSSKTDKYALVVLKQVNAKLKEVKHGKVVQMTLF
ncbi:MAG: hypothetical protein ACK5L5_11670 [Bacteroidales bacterium]